jgi:very-short-patch-repair endonuclease
MKRRARELRRDQTEAESLLWRAIRGEQLGGHKFRRQQTIGAYIVDFVSLDAKLVLELDGGQHADAVDYDAKRDAWLTSEGFHVLRFWNNDVMENLEGVLMNIADGAVTPTPTLPPRGGGRKADHHQQGGGSTTMTYKDLLTILLDCQDLPRDAMLAAMHALMGGEYTPAQIAGFLVAMRMKGETVTEIAAAAEVMRELSIKVPLGDVPYLVDTCGTGGDGAHTFNISTAAVFAAAACGAHVAKHGGRSVSSTSGSADVLEALGVNVSLTPEKLAEAVRTLGVGFMFAPNHHSAMKHAAPVRRELGVRTLFNMLGPLTNPAGAPNQVLGVYSRELTGKLARVLQALGSRHVLVVHAEEGSGRDQPGLADLGRRTQGRPRLRIRTRARPVRPAAGAGQ